MKAVVIFLISACVCAAIELKLLREDGTPFVDDGTVEVRCQESTRDDGSRQLQCRVISHRKDRLFLKIAAVSDELSAEKLTVFNGRNERPFTGSTMQNKLLTDEAFLMVAAWNGRKGLALALGAEDMNSFADFKVVRTADKAALQVAVNAAFLREGQAYQCNFHQIPFNAKYGIRDALARYYQLYPSRFKRNKDVTPKIFGICAEYQSWIANCPEKCRQSGATWEWCFAAERSWGDPCNLELPDNTSNYFRIDPIVYTTREGRRVHLRNSTLSLDEFAKLRNERLAFGYRCGVANGFYQMTLAVISNKIARRYPDSQPTHHGFPSNYKEGTEIFVFPEVSWGQKMREYMTTLAAQADVGCMAFDVSEPHAVYRGDALAKMNNVGFDEFGEGVARGIGNAKLFEFVRSLPCSRLPGRVGVAVNTYYTQLTDMLYADNVMVERAPWDKEPPFPLEYRYALGEKGLQLWEGYSLGGFDPNYKKWTHEQETAVVNDLSHYAVHRSFQSGASLPSYFLTEYTARMAYPFIACNDAGWKPVLGALAPENTQLARYGLGENSFIAVNNLVRKRQTYTMEVFPDELRAGVVESDASRRPILFASHIGPVCRNIIRDGGEYLQFEIPCQLVNILEAVGSAEGTGTVNAQWSGTFDDVALTLTSVDFAGTIVPRDSFGTYGRSGKGNIAMQAGQRVVVHYRNSVMHGTFASARGLLPAQGGNCVIHYGKGQEARDIAERLQAFVVAACKANVSLQEVAHMPLFTVTLGDVPAQATQGVPSAQAIPYGIFADNRMLAIRGSDRWNLDDIARRAINAMNRELYPNYLPEIRMAPEDSAFFNFQRY